MNTTSEFLLRQFSPFRSRSGEWKLQPRLCSRDTYVERLPGESANDRNDRAIRRVIRYLQSHLAEQGLPIKVVLLTNDRECLALARKEGSTAFTLKEYVSGMGKPDLLDKISVTGDVLNEVSRLLGLFLRKLSGSVFSQFLGDPGNSAREFFRKRPVFSGGPGRK